MCGTLIANCITYRPRHCMRNLIVIKWVCFSGANGHWEANVQVNSKTEARFTCLTDARPGVDRMRFVIPIIKYGSKTKSVLQLLLKANFHSALDARYAMDQGYVWSVFIHPLSTLTPHQAKDGIQQVQTDQCSISSNYGDICMA